MPLFPVWLFNSGAPPGAVQQQQPAHQPHCYHSTGQVGDFSTKRRQLGQNFGHRHCIVCLWVYWTYDNNEADGQVAAVEQSQVSLLS